MLWNPKDQGFNFEWPTEEDWAEMSPDTKIESIEFTSENGILLSIYVRLTNKEEVKFMASYKEPTYSQTIDFDPNE